MEVYINLESLEDITDNALLKISRKNGKPEIVKIVKLQDLNDHDKQVRKEVCDWIKQKIKQIDDVYKYPDYDKSDAVEYVLDAVEEILDQI